MPPPSLAPLRVSLRAADLGPGAEGVITEVYGAADRIERLAAMGLAPGVAFRVMRAGSPMTLAVGEARIALGRALAESLLVASS